MDKKKRTAMWQIIVLTISVLISTAIVTQENTLIYTIAVIGLAAIGMLTSGYFIRKEEAAANKRSKEAGDKHQKFM